MEIDIHIIMIHDLRYVQPKIMGIPFYIEMGFIYFLPT